MQRLFFEDLWARGTLPKELRLLIRYKVSTNNACVYCAAHQIFHLNALGDHAEKIRAHPRFRDASGLLRARSARRSPSPTP